MTPGVYFASNASQMSSAVCITRRSTFTQDWNSLFTPAKSLSHLSLPSPASGNIWHVMRNPVRSKIPGIRSGNNRDLKLVAPSVYRDPWVIHGYWARNNNRAVVRTCVECQTDWSASSQQTLMWTIIVSRSRSQSLGSGPDQSARILNILARLNSDIPFLPNDSPCGSRFLSDSGLAL